MFHKVILAAVLTVTGATAIADTPALDKREDNQKDRIEQGVKSGELTRPETRRLARSEHRLERNEARAKSDGVMTGRERARLHNEAGRNSARIYRQKHDRQRRE